jgi:hypothetical protein
MSEYLWSGRTATWSNDSRTWLNSLFTGTAVMGMSTDMPHRHLSTWTTYSGTWDSLASQTEEWGYIPSIAVSRTATLAATSNINIPTVGFALVGEAVFALNAGQTSSATSIYPSSITLAVTQDQSSVGNIVMVESITYANTLNIPLPGTTTWDLETSTWTSTTGSWGYAPPVTLSVAANITQVMLSSLNAEDIEKIATALMPTDLGVSATVTLIMPFSGTLANEQDMKFNINFEETATLAALSGTTSDNSFLWNDIAEDTGSTWTKVSDPDE